MEMRSLRPLVYIKLDCLALIPKVSEMNCSAQKPIILHVFVCQCKMNVNTGASVCLAHLPIWVCRCVSGISLTLHLNKVVSGCSETRVSAATPGR